ncbi:dihydroneopterin aldolase [Sodalis sp. CWE]|nr:dihydroneopterin aldolase [Sodalis sp. CWE]
MRHHEVTDIVFIEQLTVLTTIGVYEWEKTRSQKLIFDLEMGWDNRKAARSDNIVDCLDYENVATSVLSFLVKKNFSLIERAAEETAGYLISQFELLWIRLKISKPNAIPQAANVGVIIERWKKEEIKL